MPRVPDDAFLPNVWPAEATHFGRSTSTGLLLALWLGHGRWHYRAFRHGNWDAVQWLTYNYVDLYVPNLQEIPRRDPGLRVPPAQCGVTGQLEKGTTMPVMTGARRVSRTDTLTLTRKNVKPGQVFVAKDARTGAWGKTKYACLDSNGRYYSLKITENGDMNLAATDNGNTEVKIVGKWALNANILRNGDRKVTTRGQVQDGELFAVKGGKKTYAHVGTLNDGRAFSMVLNSDNHGVTRNMRSKVTVVGSYTIDVSITG